MTTAIHPHSEPEMLDAEAFLTFHETWFDLTTTQQQILKLLRRFYNLRINPRIRPKIKWLSKTIGVVRETISRALRRLIELGFVIVINRGRRGNEYALPGWMRKLDLNKPRSWMNLDVQTADELFKTPVDSKKKGLVDTLVEKLKVTLKVTSKVTLSPGVNFVTDQPIGISNTGSLGAGGSVHNASRSEHPTNSYDRFLSYLKIEFGGPAEVWSRWKGFRLETGELLTDSDLRQWIQSHGPSAAQGALLAYLAETIRRGRHGTNTAPYGVRYIQRKLTTGSWQHDLNRFFNERTALNHLAKYNPEGFYQVADGRAYFDRERRIWLDLDCDPERFEQLLSDRLGVTAKPPKQRFRELDGVMDAQGLYFEEYRKWAPVRRRSE